LCLQTKIRTTAANFRTTSSALDKTEVTHSHFLTGKRFYDTGDAHNNSETRNVVTRAL